MKVLLLAPQPFYIERGTPIDVDLLLRALSERGTQVDAVVYPQGKDRQYPHVRLHRVRAPAWLAPRGPGFSLSKLICDVLLFRAAARLAREHRYDVVHAGEEAVFIAWYLRWRCGLPYIYDMDSSIAQQLVEQFRFLRPLSRLFAACERLVTRRCVAAAPVCNALADLARAHGAPHVVTLHDISQLADPDREPTGELRRRLGIEGPLLLYVGNLAPYQGIDLLLEAHAVALRRGADADLVIAGGSDHEIAVYRSRIEKLGIDHRTHLIGPWPVERLDELLAEADILAAPRIKGINTPMKIFPYLHSGRPVLVTDLPTHTQLLTEEVAVLAPPEPEGFGDAIVRLSGDGALRARIGAAGRALVERDHTYPAHRRRVDELYEHVERVCLGAAAPVPAVAEAS